MIETGVDMSTKRKIIFSCFFLSILVFSLANPLPARADFAVTTITPNLVINDIPNTINISGTDFLDGAQVKVGVTEVTTTFVSATSLTAIIPPGFTPGIYNVEVILPGPTSIVIPAGLTVAAPTPMPTATATQPPFARPQVVIGSYSTNASGGIRYGQEFNLTVRLTNSGGVRAYGIQVTFSSSELLMLRNGGVQAVGNLNNGSSVDLSQAMTAAKPFYGVSSTAMEMNVSYYDMNGVAFSEKFNLILGVYNTYTGIISATATPIAVSQSQLIVSDYKTDVPILEPGLLFNLELSIQNKGNLPAKSVTMIIGGGSVSGGGSGTPGPGGVSGNGGDFSNFAPVGSSNVQSLGDIPAQSGLTARQQMIVNVNTNPGAYPMKVTLSYTDSHGNQINDEQVITLLVYRLPNIDISYYQPVFDFYTYQSNLLPLQIVNQGRNAVILGNVKVTSEAGTIENGQTFVGPLESGGYFTLDAMLTPEMSGQVEVLVSIEYSDDFNQSRTITETLTINVIEMPVDPVIDPSSPDLNGDIPLESNETFWQKVWRFILGLFGLDSAAPVNSSPIPVEPGIEQPIPMPGGKG